MLADPSSISQHSTEDIEQNEKDDSVLEPDPENRAPDGVANWNLRNVQAKRLIGGGSWIHVPARARDA